MKKPNIADIQGHGITEFYTVDQVSEMIDALIKVVKDHDDAWNLDAWNLLNVDTYNMCVKALEKAGVEL
jgi:hypothetical protein